MSQTFAIAIKGLYIMETIDERYHWLVIQVKFHYYLAFKNFSMSFIEYLKAHLKNGLMLNFIFLHA